MTNVPADVMETLQEIKKETNVNADDKSTHFEPGTPTTVLLPIESGSTDVNNKPVEISVSPTKESLQNKIISEANNADSDNKKPAVIKRRQRPEITLLYAPELTTIKFSNIDKPGSNYGLLIGYPLSKKFTIQTGIVRSRKNYIANGKDFRHTSSGSHKLKKAGGYCLMYEIPLNIKSQITNGRKINFFYTAGVSSYFMTSEFYTYHYTTNYGGYSKNVQYNSQQNYWLSVGTIGLGVEKQISNTLNIAAMPYLKIPFRGMGAGYLKLLSSGINFSLSYRQPSKK